MNVHEPIGYRTAKWLLAGFIAMGIVVVVAVSAMANVGVTRAGASYSGLRNPGNCEVLVENGGELHVKCTSKAGANGPAYVRYRFLKDVGAVRDLATVTANIRTWVGEPCYVEWMIDAPYTSARTARVTVPAGSYCHITSVSWRQP